MHSSLDEGAPPRLSQPLSNDMDVEPETGVVHYQPGATATVLRKPGQSIQDVIAQEWTPEDREVIRSTVARHSTDAELRVFLWLCMRYGMDPFLGEMWCYKRLKANDRPEEVPAIISVSVDGYLRHAATQEGYMGPPQFGVVREGDHFTVDWVNGVVEHVSEKPTGRIIGAWARGERKHCKPVVMFVPWEEATPNYDFSRQSQNPWNTQPSMMIVKVPVGYVTRRLYPMGGLPTKEELDTGVLQEAVEYTGAHKAKESRAKAPPRTVADQLLSARMEDAAKFLLSYRGYGTTSVNRKAAEFFQAEQEFLESTLKAPYETKRWAALQEADSFRDDLEILVTEFGLEFTEDGWARFQEGSPPGPTSMGEALNARGLYANPPGRYGVDAT